MLLLFESRRTSVEIANAFVVLISNSSLSRGKFMNQRFLRPVLCMVFAVTAVHSQLVTSFEDPAQVAMFAPSGLQAQPVSEHATEGKYALRVQVKGSEKDTWPGLT